MSVLTSNASSQSIKRKWDSHADLLLESLSELPLILVLSDQAGNTLYASREAGVVFGLETDSRGNFSEILRSLGPETAAAIAEIMANEGMWAGDIRASLPDGSQALIELGARRVSRSDGSYNDIFFGQDVTARRFKNRAACRNEIVSTRGDMAGEISHELNNYLSIVMGNLELLGMAAERGKFDSVGTRLRSMKDGLDRIVKFVEGLMSLCRPDSNREILYIQRLLDEEIFFLRGDARFKGVDFIRNWKDDLPPVEADRSRLRLGLVNILTNAADAVSTNKVGDRKITIEISFDSSDSRIQLSICDNGPGMSDDEYQKAFRQFFTTKGPGHGFGLLAIKGAIKSQGGMVTVSPGAGGGACFKVDLPSLQSKNH